ncbi:extracellular calcium-sensing receptor-like [Pelobates cultripes]|uniref:Extracellular calcium-sensing receptor-like n=1 Tax=Pelobates cultripes TaxID=61616 RepID=A0AAD1RIX0_PELCU|nr:extracellular calcium-sensing receptor-like [Pelobates cultripes]
MIKGPLNITISLLLSLLWALPCIFAGNISTDVGPNLGCHLSPPLITGNLSRPGDIVIGGMFLIHVDRLYSKMDFKNRPDLKCQTMQLTSDKVLGCSFQAMIFAMEKINANSDLLPNITLGFKIFDTCSAMRRAVEGTFWMLSGGSKSIPNYQWQEKTHLAGIIGDSGSVRSILMAQILGIYRYPQISYFASSPILSNRNQFPSFFRTIPSDEFQSRGLAQLVTYFGWSWVGLLAIDNDYGLLGIQVIKEELLMSGACVAFVENILTNLPNRNAPQIVKTIRESTARVIVVVSATFDFIPVLEELLRQNVSGKIWVASESWSTSALLTSKRFQEILVGTIGFAIHSGWMLGFTEYLNSFHPSKYPDDDFAIDLWEHIFSCDWLEKRNNRTTQECTGGEKLESYITKPDFRLSFNVYTSVYTFAWALQSLLQCKSGSGPFHEGECANISSFRPWCQLLHYVKNTNFQADDKTRIFFNHNGDPPAIYDIVNWQLGTSGDLEQMLLSAISAHGTCGRITNRIHAYCEKLQPSSPGPVDSLRNSQESADLACIRCNFAVPMFFVNKVINKL